MKIALHTIHSSQYPETIGVSTENKMRYAAIRNYDLHIDEKMIDPARPQGWNRLQMIRRLLPRYDWILAMTEWGVIANYRVAVEQLVSDERDLFLSYRPVVGACNQMLIRNCPAIGALLDDVCAHGDIAEGPVGEHEAFLKALYSEKFGVRCGMYPANLMSCPPQDFGGAGNFIIETYSAAGPRCTAYYAIGYETINIKERSEFGRLFTELGLMGAGAEIGVEAADYSEVLRGGWAGRELYLIDPWRNDNMYADVNNNEASECDRLYQSVVEKFGDDPGVKVVRATSLEAAGGFADGMFDWVYIDGDHSYRAVMEDLRAWYPKVRRGGILAGHDYVDGFPAVVEPPQWNSPAGNFGVRTAVTEFAKELPIRVYQTSETNGDAWSWYFVKV